MRSRIYFLTVAVSASLLRNTLTFSSDHQLPKLRSAVLVPGYLNGSDDFEPMAKALTERGVRTVTMPMPSWHWLPCLGGRSVRPILERLEFTVRHLAAAGDEEISVPSYQYNIADCWKDFRNNPGGVYQVGGSSRVDNYPLVNPQGIFPEAPNEPKGSVALIGHSAAGWIGRIFCSGRAYGGRVYSGHHLVHSLVTLGTPHASAPGFAFESINWCNENDNFRESNIRRLAVAGSGFSGEEWGDFTSGAYAFCCSKRSDGKSYDGDGVTPLFSAVALNGAEQMVLPGVHHLCWSDVLGGSLVAPELTKDYKETRQWYGSENVIDQWVDFLKDL